MVTRIYKNPDDLAKALGMTARNLVRNSTEALHWLADYGKARAIQAAPAKSGALKAGIINRKFKKRAIIKSVVPKPFPYNLWVNQEPGYTVLNYPRGGPFGIKRGGTAIYGKEPRHWTWTGIPGYFTFVANELSRDKLAKRFNIAVEKALKEV